LELAKFADWEGTDENNDEEEAKQNLDQQEMKQRE
jgi:hypothetical protein